MTKADLQIKLIGAYQQLAYQWDQTGSCPCGARQENLRTHSHVIGCPTAAAVKWLDDAKNQPPMPATD